MKSYHFAIIPTLPPAPLDAPPPPAAALHPIPTAAAAHPLLQLVLLLLLRYKL